MLSRLDEDHSHLFPSPSAPPRAVRMSDRTHITLDSFHIHTNHMHNIQPPEQKTNRARRTLQTVFALSRHQLQKGRAA